MNFTSLLGVNIAGVLESSGMGPLLGPGVGTGGGAGGSYGGSGGKNLCNSTSFALLDYQVSCILSYN